MVTAMREMKDSGIEYLGLIPTNWAVIPVKFFFDIGRGRVISVLDLSENGKYPVYSSQTENNGCFGYLDTYDYSGPAITWTTDGAKAGTVFYRDGKYNCTNVCGILSFKPGNIKKSDIKFMTYAISMAAEQNKRADINGFKIMSNEMARIRFAIPLDIHEQHNIGIFLDAKCTKIDALSADIQSEIDTLEAYKRSVITEAVTKGLDKNATMKESRIFYMAPYNANWRLSKIGYECTKLSRTFESEDKPLLCTNKGKVAIRPEEMSGRMVSEDNAMQGIHKGDIAIHGMDTWHGAIALSDYNGKITRVVHVCDSNHDKRFIVYYLQQLAFNGVYKLISNGVRGNTSDFRSWDKVADIYIALPEKNEQIQISDYLDVTCSEIESIIAQKQEQLAVLSDYKKSVIYEYVTGKKEVSYGNI